MVYRECEWNTADRRDRGTGGDMEKWTDEDVQALLNIYSEENIQREFESSARNARVYAQISARLEELGIRHSPQRCREKIKKMKQDYKKIKDHNRLNGANRRSGKWFERLDAILGARRGRGHEPGCGEGGDCGRSEESGGGVSALLEPLTDPHKEEEEGEEEEEEEEVSFTEDDQYSELSFGSPAAPGRPSPRPAKQPHLRAPGPRKRRRVGDVLEVLRELEEEQMEALRRDYEQRERHFTLLLQHIRDEFSVRQEEVARARRQQTEYQQGVLSLLSQLVHVLSSRTVPSTPPLD